MAEHQELGSCVDLRGQKFCQKQQMSFVYVISEGQNWFLERRLSALLCACTQIMTCLPQLLTVSRLICYKWRKIIIYGYWTCVLGFHRQVTLVQ